MQNGEIEFILPLGFNDEDGNLIRNGTMRPATANDELVVQEHEQNQFNKRYRDILILSRVVTGLGEMKKVTPETIEELFEMDFIYLQMLYRELNGSSERKAAVQCPACGNSDEIGLADLYKDMQYAFENGKEG